MTGSGSPCGACKFLRRKCVRGCVFAPYFCHEQGATHFAAIHKVFGASNASKLLAHLPVSDRCEAAVTISYEAQARLQDPIYGCVSHIFALQKQVVNLQAQLASLKEIAAQSFPNPTTNANPNEGLYGKFPSYSQDHHHLQSWFQSETSNMMPQFNPNQTSSVETLSCYQNGLMEYSTEDHANSVIPGENVSYTRFERASHSMDSRWTFQDDTNDLQAVGFEYIQH
ncbi:LOB domain-containing protein 29-like [Cornus florida]|uniref:LOB domain-containing protein 29-like n=1 Tax=Cornus florida TaxID=4283 RepID=UPI00289AEFA2|nr:LOB domain-containing protein 29-like [Cornus florida]